MISIITENNRILKQLTISKLRMPFFESGLPSGSQHWNNPFLQEN
ncbi:16084_t:CDS:2, partial [Gigaspora margarita]